LTPTVSTKDRRGLNWLDAASFSVARGELVAIVGGSGAGNTTLLEAMAGVTPATSRCVCFDGADLCFNLRTFRSVLGYVPQDDIIHAELPLEHTLRYAAWLRLPPSATATEVDAGRR
jgi:ABC-type multidrug transport system ATPase subunit